jgi:hypothetical protein
LQVAIDDHHRGPTSFPYTTQISILLQLASSPTAVDKNQKKVSVKRNVGNGNYPYPELPSPSPRNPPARHALRVFEFILDDALHVHSAITATKKETKKGGKKEEGTWKEGRTNSREKAGGRKIEIPHCILPTLSLHFFCAFPAPPDL